MSKIAILILLSLLGSFFTWNRPSYASDSPVYAANGELVVSTLENGKWVEQGSLAFDRFISKQTLQLNHFESDKPAAIKIVKKGGGKSHLDSVFLGTQSPNDVNGDADFAVRKLSATDQDLINVEETGMILKFPAGHLTNSLTIAARIEPEYNGKFPFMFPDSNTYKEMDVNSEFYSYQLNSSFGNMVMDGELDEVASKDPFFKKYTAPASGHPEGYTYGWVWNDDKNLYVAIDFTPDNTMDGDADYTKVYVNTPSGVKEYKAYVPDTTWGKPFFTYTDKVSYQHKVYEYQIPLVDIGIAANQSVLELAFAAYGSAAPASAADHDNHGGVDGRDISVSWPPSPLETKIYIVPASVDIDSSNVSDFKPKATLAPGVFSWTGTADITKDSEGEGNTLVGGNYKAFIDTGTFTYSVPFALVSDVYEPTADPAGGVMLSGSTIKLSSATAEATIYYTTDGNTPTSSSNSGTNVTITGTAGSTVTLKAIAKAAGVTDPSMVMTQNYTIAEQATAPAANPSGGAVASGTAVALTTATGGASIYYTTDGSTPTSSSTLYTSPISITSATTIKAIAVKTDMLDSAVMSESYTLMLPADTPAANPSGGAVASGTAVALTTATGGASIYYTTDGSMPTGSSTLYTSPISITSTTTIKAIAVKAGMLNSAVMSESYTLMLSADTPVANPSGGAVASGTTVALTTATGGASIYYTTDGSTPTSSSTRYTSPISITSATTIKAIAVKAGMSDSPVMSKSYTILSPIPSGGSTILPPTPRGDSSSTVIKPVIDQNGITLDPANMDTTKPSVTLEVTPKDGAVYVSIPANILTSFEGKNATFFIEIKTPYGSYQLPVNLASLIPGLNDLLAKNNLKAEDISFKITLTDKSDDKDIQGALANALPNGKVIGAIVDFHIDIINIKTNQTIGTADKFSKSLTRIIPMPKNMKDMPTQWGAFRYNETTKKFEFVAAKKVQIDGVWYIVINSYSNSVYVVTENAASFTDVQKHWSQSFVELAAAKGLVEGVGGDKYDPDKSVTRAEFTAMLVRVLGRGAATGSAAPYDDVKQGAWYFDEIAKAKELGLLGFVKSTNFNPDQPLTREEMASMLAAVVALEKLSLTKEYVSMVGYKDIGSVGTAYLEDVRLMVKLKIMTGTGEDTFSPKGETTRAQAAAVFVRTLQKLGMLN